MKKRLFYLLLAAIVMPFTMHAQSNAATHLDTTISACGSYTWTVNETTYTVSGAYTAIVNDTLYILDLTINPTYSNTTPISIHGGCTYTWGDSVYNTSGVHQQTFETIYGCDSLVTISLTLDTMAYKNYNAIACESYEWKDSTYTTSGTYELTQTENGCDSVLTLTLVIIEPTQISYDTTITKCEMAQYRFGGAYYMYIYEDTDTNSDAYSHTNASTEAAFHPRTTTKCFDSTAYIHFRIKKNQTYNMSVSSCDNYSIHVGDSTYTYNFTTLDTIKAGKAYNNCDSLIILNLTVHASPALTIEGDLRVTPGNDAELHAVCDQTITYEWSTGETTESITLKNVTENTDVSLTGTNNTTGCSKLVNVTIMANEGIANVDNNTISVYPNPTSSMITIQADDAVKEVTLYNVNGQKVMAGNKTNIDLSSLNNGTYVVRVEMQNGQVATRTIVLSK